MSHALFPLLEHAAVELYWACTHFLIHCSTLLGVTYRDANAALFFLLWPAVTLLLVATTLWQAVVLRRERRARG